MKQLAQGIASLGRGEDKMLVHMTPGEVAGLQHLAMSHGGSLTINPKTGLAEAGFLSSLLSIGGGIVGGMFGGPMGAAAGSSLGSLVGGDDPKTALMHGAMSGIGGALFGSAAGAASQAPAEVESRALSSALTDAPPLAAQNIATSINPPMPIPTYPPPISNAYGESYAPMGQQMQYDLGQGVSDINPDFSGSAAPVAPPTTQDQMNAQDRTENYQSTPNKPGMFDKVTDYIKANPIKSGLGAYAAYSLLNSKPGTVASQAGPGGNVYKYDYSPAQYGPDGRPIRQASYGTPTVTHYAAAGGPIRFAKGGDIYSDDPGVGPYSDSAGRGPYSDAAGKGPYSSKESGLSQQMRKASPAVLTRYAEKAYGADVQAAAVKELQSRSAAVRDYGDETKFAVGGIASLPNEYAAGGKLLQGPGDGMSDSIPAVIKGPRPQRAALAQGEFVIPADVVSHLGNGSTDAGSKRLYAMMDKIRHARTGTKKQGKQINPNQFLPA